MDQEKEQPSYRDYYHRMKPPKEPQQRTMSTNYAIPAPTIAPNSFPSPIEHINSHKMASDPFIQYGRNEIMIPTHHTFPSLGVNTTGRKMAFDSFIEHGAQQAAIIPPLQTIEEREKRRAEAFERAMASRSFRQYGAQPDPRGTPLPTMKCDESRIEEVERGIPSRLTTMDFFMQYDVKGIPSPKFLQTIERRRGKAIEEARRAMPSKLRATALPFQPQTYPVSGYVYAQSSSSSGTFLTQVNGEDGASIKAGSLPSVYNEDFLRCLAEPIYNFSGSQPVGNTPVCMDCASFAGFTSRDSWLTHRELEHNDLKEHPLLPQPREYAAYVPTISIQAPPRSQRTGNYEKQHPLLPRPRGPGTYEPMRSIQASNRNQVEKFQQHHVRLLPHQDYIGSMPTVLVKVTDQSQAPLSHFSSDSRDDMRRLEDIQLEGNGQAAIKNPYAPPWTAINFTSPTRIGLREALAAIRVGKIYHITRYESEFRVVFFRSEEATALLEQVSQSKLLIRGLPVTKASWSERQSHMISGSIAFQQSRSRTIDVRRSAVISHDQLPFDSLKRGLLEIQYFRCKVEHRMIIQRLVYTSVDQHSLKAFNLLRRLTHWHVEFGPDPCDPLAEVPSNCSPHPFYVTHPTQYGAIEPKTVMITSRGVSYHEQNNSASTVDQDMKTDKNSREVENKASDQVEIIRGMGADEGREEKKFQRKNKGFRAERAKAAANTSYRELPNEGQINSLSRTAIVIAEASYSNSAMSNVETNFDERGGRRGRRIPRGKLARLEDLKASTSSPLSLSALMDNSLGVSLSRNQQKKAAKREAKKMLGDEATEKMKLLDIGDDAQEVRRV